MQVLKCIYTESFCLHTPIWKHISIFAYRLTCMLKVNRLYIHPLEDPTLNVCKCFSRAVASDMDGKGQKFTKRNSMNETVGKHYD